MNVPQEYNSLEAKNTSFEILTKHLQTTFLLPYVRKKNTTKYPEVKCTYLSGELHLTTVKVAKL